MIEQHSLRCRVHKPHRTALYSVEAIEFQLPRKCTQIHQFDFFFIFFMAWALICVPFGLANSNTGWNVFFHFELNQNCTPHALRFVDRALSRRTQYYFYLFYNNFVLLIYGVDLMCVYALDMNMVNEVSINDRQERTMKTRAGVIYCRLSNSNVKVFFFFTFYCILL